MHFIVAIFQILTVVSNDAVAKTSGLEGLK
jgi:hypothetical protein